MKKKRLIAASLAAVIGVMTWMTPDSVRADEHEVEVPQLEEGTYVKGEALVSMTTTQADRKSTRLNSSHMA